MVQLSFVLFALFLASSTVAHPGESVNRDIRRRLAHLNHAERRSVADCKSNLVKRGWVRDQHVRRENRLHELRVAAGFAKPGEVRRRDVAEVEQAFGDASSCTLDPEMTEGPYWVTGELIRSDLLNTEVGVKVHLDVNVVDTSTCEPVPNAYVELWGTNATGVYTGVQASGNGDSSNTALFSNALRGLQPTAENGTATFTSLIPGHYVGRANHLHTIIHHNAELLPNNTIRGGTISHVGQFFVDQDLLDKVEATTPYNTNTQEQTLNADDILWPSATEGGDDPVIKATLLGEKIEDGLYAYIEVGINPKAVQEPKPVNFWTGTEAIPVPDSPWAGYPSSCQYCSGPPPQATGSALSS